MKTKQIFRIMVLLVVSLAVFFASIPAQAASDAKKKDANPKVTIKGLIVNRDGDNVMVKDEAGIKTVTLTPGTYIKVVKGVLGIRRKEMGMTALIPGLRVTIKAENVGDKTYARSISFKADDLKTANEIQAGLYGTQQQVVANKESIEKGQDESAALSKRFGELGDYEVKGEATVLFAVNSATLTPKAKEDLKALADNAKKIDKFLIQVSGYTDASGKADYNQDLSERRAASVVKYLQQNCAVPIARVLSPAAMGMSKPAASNETDKGKAQNRRVEVKILVNRGVQQEVKQ